MSQLCSIVLYSRAVSVKSTPYLIPIVPISQGETLYLYYPSEPTINDFLFPELMDYPESDEDCGVRAADIASGTAILDTDDMETGNSAPPEASWSLSGAPRRPDVPPAGVSGNTSAADRACPSAGSSRRPTTSSAGESQPIDSPDLPPIYRTVKKDREKNMVTHTLLGSGPNRAVCTVYGASVSQINPIGSFANAGDKRHNITSHRFDFKNKRNLSTSFDTGNLQCTTCQHAHTVLRREIEEGDVGLDTPPVFVLSDQNFPAMLPAGGGWGWHLSKNHFNRARYTDRTGERLPRDHQGFCNPCRQCPAAVLGQPHGICRHG
jgi:hypothetical protein